METLTVQFVIASNVNLMDKIQEEITEKQKSGFFVIMLYSNGIWFSPSPQARKNPPNAYNVEITFSKRTS